LVESELSFIFEVSIGNGLLDFGGVEEWVGGFEIKFFNCGELDVFIV